LRDVVVVGVGPGLDAVGALRAGETAKIVVREALRLVGGAVILGLCEQAGGVVGVREIEEIDGALRDAVGLQAAGVVECAGRADAAGELERGPAAARVVGGGGEPAGERRLEAAGRVVALSSVPSGKISRRMRSWASYSVLCERVTGPACAANWRVTRTMRPRMSWSKSTRPAASSTAVSLPRCRSRRGPGRGRRCSGLRRAACRRDRGRAR
jgi:hypothetical protein